MIVGRVAIIILGLSFFITCGGYWDFVFAIRLIIAAFRSLLYLFHILLKGLSPPLLELIFLRLLIHQLLQSFVLLDWLLLFFGLHLLFL